MIGEAVRCDAMADEEREPKSLGADRPGADEPSTGGGRSRRTKVLVGVAVAVVAGAVGVIAAVLLRKPALPRAEVAQYLHGWDHFDPAQMASVVQQPAPDLAPAVTAMKRDLHVTGLGAFTTSRIRRTGAGADATYDARFTVGGVGEVRYRGTLHLVRRAGAWKVVWSPAALHPAMRTGFHFTRSRHWPTRAPILDHNGRPLVAVTDAVSIGIEPDHMKDVRAVQTALQQQLAVDPAAVTAALAKPRAREDVFVPVTQIRTDRFAQVRPALEPVPGIVFQKVPARLAPSDGFAAHVLGRVGEITADRLKQLGAPYDVGDTVGLSGLEAVDERVLAGTPTAEARIVDTGGHTVQVLVHLDGTPAKAVQTTLDPAVQQAAEQAVAGVAQPSAIVALDVSTGEIRAVVSRPLDQPFDRALAGRYPPGSTFKVVTSAALLGAGTTPETVVTCPPTANIGGRTFKNFEGEAAGSIPFRRAFAISCNTAFVTLADKLTATALTASATSFGFGATYSLPLDTAGGQFPVPGDATEKAAAAIGQAKVVASPLHMATVAAAVASGAWRPPVLLSGPDAPVAGAPLPPLPPGVAAALTSMMTDVVRSGTGTAAAVAGGAPVAGKTGTAEFGTANPPTTHAWFIGFRGSLAFCVFVEGGGVGGRVAAPIAAKFLSAVPV